MRELIRSDLIARQMPLVVWFGSAGQIGAGVGKLCAAVFRGVDLVVLQVVRLVLNGRSVASDSIEASAISRQN